MRVVVIICGCSPDGSWCSSGVMVAVYYCPCCQKLFFGNTADICPVMVIQ